MTDTEEPVTTRSEPAHAFAGHLSASDWWRRAVVYQIYPRSFADSDGDGVGDLRGILSRLDHLADLGVDVVWLSPVYTSPQDDNGYDISDYFAIDPVFGTLEDFDALVTAVHARGMRLVMDLVVNHTSDEHPWFLESRSSLDNPKRDWYWWRPPRTGMAGGAPGAEPTNWASFFGGPAWEYDPATGEYYLHLFSRKQPDLNWENADVRQAVYAMMRWWVERGVDGFRMDVINFISKRVDPDGLLHDAPSGLEGGLGNGAAEFTCGPRIHDYLTEMHAAVFAGHPEHLLTVGEMPGVTVEDAVLFTDPARAELDMVFQFEHVGIDHGESKWLRKPFDLRALKASFGRWQAGLADRGWNSLYWNNHDQPRIVSRWGDDRAYRVRSATCLATLLHLHRGTPYIYQGEELGMRNYPWTSPEEFRDIESVNLLAEQIAVGRSPSDVVAEVAWVSRDNARTPVQWDGSDNAGFTTGTSWLPVNPDYADWNAAAQRDDPASVLSHYRRLIELRHHLPVVALGDFTLLLPDHPHIYAFTRRLHAPSRDELLVICNVSADEIDLSRLLPHALTARELILTNLPDEAGDDVLRRPLLSPWEARVLRVTV